MAIAVTAKKPAKTVCYGLMRFNEPLRLIRMKEDRVRKTDFPTNFLRSAIAAPAPAESRSDTFVNLIPREGCWVGVCGSGRARASVDDRPGVLAAQRGGESAGHESVHDLHLLDVARRCHDLDERTVERQCALDLCEVDGARLAQQLCLPAAWAFWISGVNAIHIFHDREAGRTERVGDQKRSRVSPVNRYA